MAKLQIGELEKLTGISKETLRHYRKKGLLNPERTGEGVSNDRTLYGPEEIERLQVIKTLRAYDFSLDEIKQILDSANVSIDAALDTRIADIKHQETQLHSLALFARFIELTDEDLIEGLAYGPAGIDEFANIIRASAGYSQALQKLHARNKENWAEPFAELLPITQDLLYADTLKGFKEVEVASDAFFNWWSAHIMPLHESGYFGFWAIFEDYQPIAALLENAFEESAPAFIEMYTYFSFMINLMKEEDERIANIAGLTEEDIIAAMEEAQKLVDSICANSFGTNCVRELSPFKRANLTYDILVYAMDIFNESDLCARFELNDALSFNSIALEKALAIVDLLGTEI